MQPIYLDYMATSPLDPAVMQAMQPCLFEIFGNPASQHFHGWQAQELISRARAQVAAAINAQPEEIIWTSGATEAINLALKGAAYFYKRQGKHLITWRTEHKATLDVCAFLESQGFEVTYLNPDPTGLINFDELLKAIRPDTILISVMHVNNETGIIQEIAKLGTLTRKQGILLHVDAAQSIGKVAVNVVEMQVDLMSFSAHKVYGPKGVGALFIRHKPPVRLTPLLHGGGHEQGMRSGTLAVHQIVGMGAAFELATKQLTRDLQHIIKLRDYLWSEIQSLGGVYLNAERAPHVPHCLNIRFDGIDGEALLTALQSISISSGSACNAASSQPSHVLLVMHLTREQARASLRISLGRFTTLDEAKIAAGHIKEQVTRLRSMSPIWDEVKKRLHERFNQKN